MVCVDKSQKEDPTNIMNEIKKIADKKGIEL
ncbi:hypothetical protein C7448_104212 [Tenacibaculum gallaicum]|uniref:Uncharacterized protein n=1 Tax=Tenacibaculum gallaicum TaxID=561505 RepID=A0A3E0HWF5_9FLAO|nr:hypothetical protein C7448_104212 [Tenacibaculum gallaicum]